MQRGSGNARLGTALFLISMNDVTDNINYSKIRFFADDITIYREDETTKLMLNYFKIPKCFAALGASMAAQF